MIGRKDVGNFRAAGSARSHEAVKLLASLIAGANKACDFSQQGSSANVAYQGHMSNVSIIIRQPRSSSGILIIRTVLFTRVSFLILARIARLWYSTVAASIAVFKLLLFLARTAEAISFAHLSRSGPTSSIFCRTLRCSGSSRALPLFCHSR